MKLKRIFACLLALNMTLSVSVPVPEVGVNGKSVRAETVTPCAGNGDEGNGGGFCRRRRVLGSTCTGIC